MTETEQILVALRRISRAIDLQLKQLSKQCGLTAPQLIILRALDRGGAMPASALARTVSLSQATVTSILDRLERAGLAQRIRSTVDKRVVSVTLTPEGRTAVNRTPSLLSPAFTDEFAKLEGWERTMLVSALERIAALMDAEHLNAWPVLASGELPGPDAEPEAGPAPA